MMKFNALTVILLFILTAFGCNKTETLPSIRFDGVVINCATGEHMDNIDLNVQIGYKPVNSYLIQEPFTSDSTTTDIDGNFSFDLPYNNQTHYDYYISNTPYIEIDSTYLWFYRAEIEDFQVPIFDTILVGSRATLNTRIIADSDSLFFVSVNGSNSGTSGSINCRMSIFSGYNSGDFQGKVVNEETLSTTFIYEAFDEAKIVWGTYYEEIPGNIDHTFYDTLGIEVISLEKFGSVNIEISN